MSGEKSSVDQYIILFVKPQEIYEMVQCRVSILRYHLII